MHLDPFGGQVAINSRHAGLRRKTRRLAVPLLILPLLLFQSDGLVGQSTGAPAAQVSNAARTHETAPRAVAARLTGPIRIDGILEEETWTSTTAISQFTQLDPEEGKPVSERTLVRIAYDDDAIYLAGWMYDTGPITRRLARRDPTTGDFDFFSVIFDSYHDHQTGYSFSVNASGTRRDAIMSSGSAGGDTSWDPVWAVATRTTGEGWFFEMRIPFGQLRFSRDAVQTWGLQMQRRIDRKQENAHFSFIPKLEPGGIQRYGHLEGISDVRTTRRLELLPYLAARAEYRGAETRSMNFENPYRSGDDYFGNAGLDLKYRISSNATLDATVNPDFGQVEVDPAVINLTAFETFFQEKRPFFVEGAEIFRFGDGGPTVSAGRVPQLLYSRRIGREPQGVVPGVAVYSDEPTASTILGAAKLTAKTPSGWSFGLMNAVTGKETADWQDASGDRFSTPVEPLTNYLVGRLRRDARGGRTRVGLIGSMVHRKLHGTELDSRLRAEAFSGGVDFVHETSDRAWRLNGSFSPSYVAGDKAAILSTQRSSARYFHRPDADHLEVEADATSMAGYYAMLDLNEQAGSLQSRVALAAASPGYEVNDLGFQNAADRIILETNFLFQRTRPGRLTRNWQVRGGPDRIWNFAGDEVFNENKVFGTVQFLNYWGMGWRVAYNMQSWDDRLTRGGPRVIMPEGLNGNLTFNSDPRKRYVARSNFVWRRNTEGAWETTSGLTLTYRPSSNWQLSLGPELVRSHAIAQYVTAVPDALATSTYGRRYVFAGLDQTTLGIETRINATFTPNLSFEFYAQPLFSSGDYGLLKELRAPDTFEFLTYGVDGGSLTPAPGGLYTIDPDATGPAAAFRIPNRDFNLRSLIGNAVLRWEWRPGSTLYVVWQQSRAGELTSLDPDEAGLGIFDIGRDSRELLGLEADNIFVIKLNYWLNP